MEFRTTVSMLKETVRSHDTKINRRDLGGDADSAPSNENPPPKLTVRFESTGFDPAA